MAKFELPKGAYIDVRFTFGEAYDKKSAKGNFTLAPESGFAEVIGFAGFEDMTAVFGKFSADRGKINFYAKVAEKDLPLALRAAAADKPLTASDKAKIPANGTKGKAKAKAAPAAPEPEPAMDLTLAGFSPEDLAKLKALKAAGII